MAKRSSWSYGGDSSCLVMEIRSLCRKRIEWVQNVLTRLTFKPGSQLVSLACRGEMWEMKEKGLYQQRDPKAAAGPQFRPGSPWHGSSFLEECEDMDCGSIACGRDGMLGQKNRGKAYIFMDVWNVSCIFLWSYHPAKARGPAGGSPVLWKRISVSGPILVRKQWQNSTLPFM